MQERPHDVSKGEDLSWLRWLHHWGCGSGENRGSCITLSCFTGRLLSPDLVANEYSIGIVLLKVN